MSSIQLVNAYWASDNIVAVSRTPQGKRIAKSYPAEYSCFLKAEQVTQDVASQLKRWPRIKAWKPEGNWIRVIWRTRDDLKAATSKSKYQNQQYGGNESVFERLGIEVFEADVHPVRRFLTDYNCILQRPRRCYIDIEGDSRVPFSRKEESRILSWAVTDDTGEWRGDVLESDTDEAEHRLLQELWSVLDEYDQVCAWSGDRYDFPVIKARARLHGMTIASGGWLWVDHLEVFKSMNLQVSESGDEKQSFSLGRISTIILGETKDDLDASKTWEYWAAGGAEREKLFTYNVRDAELLRMLEAKTGYLDLLFAIAEVCHTLPDTRGHNGTNIVEGYLLKMAKTEDLHFRTCWDTFVGEKFEGAFVMEPTRKGILHNVHVCDFSGMYPSIIQTWNISPETVRRDVILKEDPAARPTYLSHLPLKEFPLPDDCCSVPGGSIFSRRPLGLIPRAIAELKAKRKYWNELKSKCAPGTPEWHDADRKSNAYKVTANKFFGVLGATTSRFYDKDVASSVTAGGRWLIRETIKAAEARGMSGIYGDTDSCFIADVTESEFRNFTTWCNTEFYPKLLKELNCPDNQISIAYEKEFSTIVLIGKKRYAGKFAHYKGTRATADSKPEIKGLEYKRGDSVKLARELQYEIVMLLMQDCEDPEEFKSRIVDWQSMVLENHLPVDEFVLSKTLSKDPRAYAKKFKQDGEPAAQPVHVTVANILAARGFDASEGVRIEYIVVDGRSPLKAIPRMDYTERCEDRYYLWENLVWPPTERVLKAAFPAVPWDKLYGSVRPKAVRQPRAATTKPKPKAPEGQGSLF